MQKIDEELQTFAQLLPKIEVRTNRFVFAFLGAISNNPDKVRKEW